jgi:hypothetical protein
MANVTDMSSHLTKVTEKPRVRCRHNAPALQRVPLAFWGILLVVALLSFDSNEAYAAVTDAVYEDVKLIISDLLTAEIAHAIVPQVACRAGREDAKATDKDQAAVISVDTTVNGQSKGEKYYRLKMLEHYPRTLQRAYSRQFGSLRASILEESADLTALLIYQGLSAETLDAIPSQVSKLVGKITKAEEQPYNALADDEHNSCADRVRAKLAEGPPPALSALDRECGQLAGGDGKALNCELALALRAALENKGPVAEDHLIRATGWAVNEVVGRSLKIQENKRARIGEIIVVAVRDMVADPKAAGKTLTETIARELTTQGIEQKSVAVAIDALKPGLERLAVQWRLASTGGTEKIDPSAFIDFLASAEGALTELCKATQAQTSICHAVAVASERLSRGKLLWPIVRAASRGDVREVAHRTILTVFRGQNPSCDEDSSSPDCQIDLYRRFAEAMVGYVIDSVQEGLPSEATRESFRSAATELISNVKGGGIDRGSWQHFLLPGLGLRASWSPGYVNKGGGSLRYVAAVSWLTFRKRFVYLERYYGAVHLALLDPIAPLSELAVRDGAAATYSYHNRLAWNVISPRLDVVFGIPSLSRHLLAGAGVGLRLVAPNSDSTLILGNTVVTHYNYEFFGKSDSPSRHVEFGFVLKYVI